MAISFGKFIPVKVFIDGKEVESQNSAIVPKEVERVTLSFCDCLTKNEKYPDGLLPEQQRRFFASKVSDYRPAIKTSKSKTEITPSSVKTANLDGQRYLVSGKDIVAVGELGHNLGKTKKQNYENAEDFVMANADGMSYRTFSREVSRVASSYNERAKNDRLSALRKMVKNNSIPETLYIYAKTNEKAKLVRDKYIIETIDFKA